MRYWLREVGGWLIVALGLLAFYACYQMLQARHVIEAGTFSVVGIFLFRGGIHLLRMAVAAQICMDAQKQMDGK
jgi:hypothetical protein